MGSSCFLSPSCLLSPAVSPKRVWAGVAAVAAALAAAVTAVVTVGCGSSTGRAAALAAAQVRAAQARTIARQAGLGPEVQAFLAKAAMASGVTYTVVYEQGTAQSTTVIARPPDRRIDVVGASGPGSTDRVVIRGTDTVVCHLAATRWTCLSGVVSDPAGPFTPDAITATIASLAQLSQSYDFAVTERPMVGLNASCLSATRRAAQPPDPTVGDHGLICLAPSGVILRVEGSGTPLQATSYRESVLSNAFALPARPTPAVTSTSTSTSSATPGPG